jgi:hypothetical protein
LPEKGFEQLRKKHEELTGYEDQILQRQNPEDPSGSYIFGIKGGTLGRGYKDHKDCRRNGGE